MSADDYVRLAAFRYALRRFLRFSQSAAEKAGLTAQHYQALLAIKAAPDPERVTINDLASQLLIRHHSTVGLVDRLVEQGVIMRRPSDRDRREVRLRLTAKGARLFERLAAKHSDELHRVGPELGRLLLDIAEAPQGARVLRPRFPARKRRAA